MLNKLFKEPNRKQKIATIILAVTAIVIFAIWFAIEAININSLIEEFPFMADTDLDGVLQNKLLIAAMCVFGTLGIALLICWFKSIVREPGKTLKILMVVLTIIALVVVVILCAVTVCKTIDDTDIVRKALYEQYNSTSYVPEQTALLLEIANLNNDEAGTITLAVLTAFLCAGGLVVGFLTFYELVDYRWRVVYSLEKLANSTENNSTTKTMHNDNQKLTEESRNV